jgi:hypothetical protein
MQLSGHLGGASPKGIIVGEGNSDEVLPNSHDSEEILPDDSSFSYIGTLPVLGSHLNIQTDFLR